MRYFLVCLFVALAGFGARADGLSNDGAQAPPGAVDKPTSQAMTAAHRRLKFNTYVRVTNLRNQRNIVVRINDRLPPRSRAIIDLTHKAARQLGMFRRGVSKVKLEIVDKTEFAATDKSQ
jgi:rare lipoprotein A